MMMRIFFQSHNVQTTVKSSLKKIESVWLRGVISLKIGLVMMMRIFFKSNDVQTTVKLVFKIKFTKARNDPVKFDKQAVKPRMVLKLKVNNVKVNGVNIAGQSAVCIVKENGVTAVKASAGLELQDKKELAIPGQTTTGKEFSNPLMAGSLPKKLEETTKKDIELPQTSVPLYHGADAGIDTSGSPRRQETIGVLLLRLGACLGERVDCALRGGHRLGGGPAVSRIEILFIGLTRLEKGVFHRLGDKRKSVSVHSDDSRRRSYHSSHKDTEICHQNSRSRATESASERRYTKRASSRRTEELSESEGSAGGHWKSKLKRQKSSIKDDLSQPWVCEETDPFTPRIRYFDFPKTRMPSHIKTYDRSEDPEDHLKIF
ncbi:hypothetical protein Tco_1402578 [Tanacetum coccineum]